MQQKDRNSSPDSANTLSGWQRQQILIVDDVEANLFSLKKVLKTVDADVVEAQSGQEALAAVLNHDFSLIILDVQMPNMDGYELAGYLRGDPKTTSVPIIFLTANYLEEESVFRGYESGAIDYITKPYMPGILISKVKILLEMDRDKHELMLHRDRLKDLVDERVAELDQARLAALNMMEDAMLAKTEAQRSAAVQAAVAEILAENITDLQLFYDRVLDQAIDLTNSQIGYIYFYSETDQRFVLNSWSRSVMPACEVTNPQTCYELGKTGLWGEAVRQRKPILINDYQAANPFKKGTPKGHIEMRNFLTVPVLEDDEIIAVVGVANKKDDYTDEDILTLQLLMNSAWKSSQELNKKRQLRAADRRSRALLDYSPACHKVVDLDGNLRYMNRNGFQMLHLEENEDLYGKPYPFDFFPETFKQEMQAALDRVKETASTEWLEGLACDVHGNKVWLDSTLIPVPNDAGDLDYITVVTADTTARKQAEQQLELTQFAVDHLQDAAYWADESGRFIYVNKASCDVLGYTEEELLQMHVWDVDVNVSCEEWPDIVDTVKTKESVLFTQIHRKKDGTTFPVEIKGTYIEFGKQKIVCGFAHDITQRETSRRELEDSQLLLRNIIDTIHNRVWWKDLDSRFMGCNSNFANDAGYKSPDQLIGKTDYDMCWKDGADGFVADDREVIESGKPKLRIEESQIRADGRVRWLETNKIPLRDYQGKIIGTVGTYADITERKRMEEALEKRIVALTRPLDDASVIEFSELFNLEEIQRIQDEFAEATGVASIITEPDGTPITEPSNFTDLCMKVIRGTEIGCTNCYKSDAMLGRPHPEGPIVQPCLSGGLWDAGASITVGGKHIASWLIGQVRDETQTEEKMLAYARKIGADEKVFMEAFCKVPSMSREQFDKIAQALFTLANQLSTSAYQNMQQARFITEQKKSEQELRESREYLQKMWDNVAVGIALIDAETQKILQINPALARISGYTQEELIGTVCHESICPACKDQCPLKGLNINLEHSERALIHKDGRSIDIEKTASTIQLDGREIYLETLVDISDRKQAESELRRLSTAINQSPETIVITDIQGNIEYVNPAFENISGYTHDEAIGQNTSILKSGQHSRSFYKHLWQTLSKGSVWNGRFINKRKDGSLYTEESVISPVKAPDGSITNYVAVKRDITNELIQEEQLQNTQKMEAIGQLAGGIAHDFNNILQAILGFSELLMLTLDSELEQPRKNVTEIQKAAQHASELTRQLLAFSRKQNLELTRENINQIVKNTISFITSIIGSNVQIKTDLDPELKPVRADSQQLERVLLNMALNARDAMPDGGELIIRTENIEFSSNDAAHSPQIRAGEFIRLSISDTGTGMSEKTVKHIFEPFFTTKEPGKGTGLGLSAIYGIIQKHQGWINVCTELHKGTMFEIYLPASNGKKNQSIHSDSGEANEVSGRGERILIVEDDPAVLNVSHNALTRAGYTAETASSAEEAEEIFNQTEEPFDLLFSDVVLLEKNGVDLALTLQEKQPNLPVLLCSGHSSDQIKKTALNQADFFFLEKPFSIINLLKVVDRILNRTQAKR